MKKNGIESVLRSFYYALRGIAFCIRHERHIRIHLCAAAYVLYFAAFYGFSPAEYAVLIITCAAVIGTELMNTAVEVVIDKISPKFNIFAMIGKDIAAGAVLLSAISAAAVGVVMLWNVEVFYRIWLYFTADWWKPALLLLSMAAAVVFIASARPRKTGAQRKDMEELKGKE